MPVNCLSPVIAKSSIHTWTQNSLIKKNNAEKVMKQLFKDNACLRKFILLMALSIDFVNTNASKVYFADDSRGTLAMDFRE